MNPPMQSTLVRHVRNTKPTETASWSSSYNSNRLAISESDLRSSATNKRRQHNVNVHWGRIFVSHVSVSASLFGVYNHFIWCYSPCRGSFMWQCCHFNLISCVKYNHPVPPPFNVRHAASLRYSWTSSALLCCYILGCLLCQGNNLKPVIRWEMGQLEGKQSIWMPFTFLVSNQCRRLDASPRFTFAGVSCGLKSCAFKSDDVYMMHQHFHYFWLISQNHVESYYCYYNILVKPISFPWFPCPVFYLIALYITVKSVTLSCEILLSRLIYHCLSLRAQQEPCWTE